MKTFAGLGNPGAKIRGGNRHNIGFMALEAIADAHGFAHGARRFQGEVSEGRLGPEKVVLLKPHTFMKSFRPIGGGGVALLQAGCL